MAIIDLPIREIHKALVEGKVAPRDLVKEALDRASKDDCNCFEMVLGENALKEVEAVGEIRQGEYLKGIPYVCKDNFSTKGMETTAGSNILNGYKPLFDATVVSKLREAGAIMVAKATMDELAMGGTGTTSHKGTTYNPYDPKHERLVGGSSSGSAASLASGIGVFATGSDTGDSVRRPASLAGLVGVKPTWGRISRYGLFPFAPSLDHVGYFTRYVDDAALLLGYLAGHDEHDMTSSNRPVEDYLDGIDDGVKDLSFVRLLDIEESMLDKRYLEAFDRLCAELESKGALIRKERFGKELLESLYATYIVISCAEATSNDANLDGIKFGPGGKGNTYVEQMMDARTKGFSELIKRRFVIGSFALMRENQDVLFLRAQRNRHKIVERCHEIFSKGEALIVPATSGIAPYEHSSTDKLSDAYLIADNHLCLGNFGGFPSVTLPLAFEDGYPIGVNITLPPFEERKMFRMARAIEDITGLGGLSVVNRKEGRL